MLSVIGQCRYWIAFFSPVLVGIIWAIPFLEKGQTGQWASLAWFVPSLILLFGRRAPFQKAYLIGLSFHLIALSWLLNIPILIGAIVGWTALSCYVAFYPALWSWFVWRMLPKGSSSNSSSSDSSFHFPLLKSLSKMNWIQRQMWFLIASSAWTAAEILQSHLLGGFPWNLLGISQITLLPIIQLASFTGVYGVSFLIVWVSLSLLGALVKIADQPSKHLAWIREILPAGMAFFLILIWGFGRVQSNSKDAQTIRLALIQPSIDQTSIWKGSRPEWRFRELTDLSEAALDHHPDLLIWPESALPSNLDSAKDRVSEFVSKHHIPLILNETAIINFAVNSKFDSKIDSKVDPKVDHEIQLYNAAILRNREGEIVDEAFKHRLVPFGEFVPLAKVFPFLRILSPIGDDFSSGPIGESLILKSPRSSSSSSSSSKSPFLKMGILICFEDAFPVSARWAAKSAPDFLLNLTNDAWFGESSAQWQHARGAAFRAIETGLPLVRSTNNGLSCWVDPFGKMHLKKGNVYEKGFHIIDLPMHLKSEDEAFQSLKKDESKDELKDKLEDESEDEFKDKLEDELKEELDDELEGELKDELEELKDGYETLELNVGGFKTPYAQYGDLFGWSCFWICLITFALIELPPLFHKKGKP